MKGNRACCQGQHVATSAASLGTRQQALSLVAVLIHWWQLVIYVHIPILRAHFQTCIPVKRHRTQKHSFWAASMFAAINEGEAEQGAFAPSGESVEAAEARIAASYEAALRLLQARQNDAAQVHAQQRKQPVF